IHHTVTRILGGSQNRQKCPKKRHLVLYKLAGFYPDGLTRRSVFKRVGGRGNPQKWPIFGPFLGVNCAKPELIPGVPPVCSHAARHIMGGDWPVGLTVTKAHSDYISIFISLTDNITGLLLASHDVRHRTQSLDALSSEIAWAYPRKSRSSLSCK